MIFFLIITVAFLAYANGANDNFKGVASLYGSKTCSYRTALAWATVTTTAGSIAALFLSTLLLKNFSGKGLVPDHLVQSPAFALAVAIGAGSTVLLATRFGFPISTTHGLTGAMVGAGLSAAADGVHLAMLGKNFILPLLLSPFLAMVTACLIYLAFKTLRKVTGVREESCVCVGGKWQPITDSSMACKASSTLSVDFDTSSECARRYHGTFFGIEAKPAMDALHFLSAGAVSFARGLNDTPKIAALLLVTAAIQPHASLLLIAAAISAGGLLQARRVAHTMSHKLTAMNAGQGFAANLSTALLVTTASLHGMPVSTTHVSVGALLGIGTVSGQAKWKMIIPVLASWVITVPLSALFAALAFSLIHAFSR